jgi:hypothetical protein
MWTNQTQRLTTFPIMIILAVGALCIVASQIMT